MMSNKPSSLNSIYIHLLFIILSAVANYSTTHGMPLADNDSKNKISTSNKKDSKQDTSATAIDPIGNPLIISSNESVEKDFDQIKKYQSYDPATNIWSQIEAFKTIKMLDDTTQIRPEHYLYYSFWAYDAQQKRWKRVNISGHGYKHGIQPVSKKAEVPKDDIDTSTDEDEKEPSNFWSNLGLSLSIGGGGTYYYNDLKNLDLFVRKGNREFYVQVPKSTDSAGGKAYLIRWFNDGIKKTYDIRNLLVAGVQDQHTLDSVSAGKMSFEGIGFNIPIALSLHYTFFKKLRLGAGGNFEINYLKELKPAGAAANINPYKLTHPWFYNLKWFGSIGYKVFQRPKDAIIIDTQLGMIYDLGNAPIENLANYVYSPSFYGNIGIAHERKINDYFKFFYRLSGDWKQHSEANRFKPNNSSIILLQPALHLEIGTTLHFGRDIEEEEDVNDDTSTDNDKNSSLGQAGNAIESSENALNKALDAQNRAQTDKAKLKSLFG